jgi:16S rRNA G966 N2-methylase RsmD
MPLLNKRNNWFLNYHETETISGLRHLNSRTKYFDICDFENKTVLDIGCNTGQMCKYSISNGASYVYGIEYDKTAVINAHKYLKDISNIDIVCDDIDNYFALSVLNKFDTVLFLSVIDTQELINRYGALSRLSEITKNTMYYEGHHSSKYDELIKNIIKYTSFKSIEFCGKTYDNPKDKIGRCFFKLTKNMSNYKNAHISIFNSIQKEDINKIAICGHGGSGKSHIRNNLIEYIKELGISIKKIYQSPQNNNMVIYETDEFYIMDDIPVIQPSFYNKKIILFDYKSQNILNTPDCIFYINSSIKQRIIHRSRDYNRSPEIKFYGFKYLYQVESI